LDSGLEVEKIRRINSGGRLFARPPQKQDR
jgi:hypothetical protein